MERLSQLENQSIYLIREAHHEIGKMAALWSTDIDCTVLLWLCRKAFFGGLPFPVVYVDPGRYPEEMYDYRDRVTQQWGLDLIVARNEEALEAGVGPESGRLSCCMALKTRALQEAVSEHDIEALLVGIRHEEDPDRETHRPGVPECSRFSGDPAEPMPLLPDLCTGRFDRDRPARVHPILEWNELDVWLYVQRENLPVNPLYFSTGQKRYRRPGCEPCASTMASDAGTVEQIIEEVLAERADTGEEAQTVEKLRSLGYL
jgi:sulfate adenylyltransferase subunit 2